MTLLVWGLEGPTAILHLTLGTDITNGSQDGIQGFWRLDRCAELCVYVFSFYISSHFVSDHLVRSDIALRRLVIMDSSLCYENCPDRWE